MPEAAHPLQARVVPKYSDDARRPASSEWRNATLGSSNRLPGVDYEKLNATLARYFENATLVENAKTQAIVVIYKVRSSRIAAYTVQTCLVSQTQEERTGLHGCPGGLRLRSAVSQMSMCWSAGLAHDKMHQNMQPLHQLGPHLCHGRHQWLALCTCLQARFTKQGMHLQGQLIGEMYSAAMDIKPSTPLISWSLAKSVTSAIVGVRSVDSTIETAFDPYQLATTPVWNASEVAARNITGERLAGLPLLVCAEQGRARMHAATLL